MLSVLGFYSHHGGLVGVVRVTDHILQAEVCLAAEVMVEVGVRDLIPLQDHGLSGHELHQPLGQQTHQQLLEQGNCQATLRGQIQLPPIFLGTRCRVQEIECISYGVPGLIMGQCLKQPLKFGITDDQEEDMFSVCHEFRWRILRKWRHKESNTHHTWCVWLGYCSILSMVVMDTGQNISEWGHFMLSSACLDMVWIVSVQLVWSHDARTCLVYHKHALANNA